LPDKIEPFPLRMTLTGKDLQLLKQLQAAGGLGRDVRETDTRALLDRLAKGQYVTARPVGVETVRYWITSRGKDAITQHDAEL
jgi:hypothetical protein